MCSISGLVVEYNVAIVVTRVRFPADAAFFVSDRRKLWVLTNNESNEKRAHPGSNQGPADLQSAALPLSYTPVKSLYKVMRTVRY